MVLLDADASFCSEDTSIRTATPSGQTCATTLHLRRNGANESRWRLRGAGGARLFSGGADLAGEPGAPTGAGSLPADYSAVGLRACSACAGEYEDPDVTSWTEVSDEGHKEELEGFPVRRD